METAKEILAEICDYHSHSLIYSEARDALIELNDLLNEDDDICFDFDGNEYRIIHDDAIWDIYVEEIKGIVNECYDLKLDQIPDWIAFSIDWEATAENAYMDGYGHHFSGYDGSETEAGGYYIFRMN